MGLTAGHCASGHLEDRVHIGDNYLSRSGMNSYVGKSESNSDAMSYTLPDESHRDDNMFVDGDTIDYRDLQPPRYTMDTLDQGDRLCFQGITTGSNNCGTVVHTDLNTNPTGPGSNPLRHQFTLSHGCAAGDSGGPVYHVRDDGTAKAGGVVQGAASGLCYFSQIGYALGHMDAERYYN